MAAYRIITFDGGGVRGALMVTLLKRLSLQFPSFLDNVDLFAGTSTGSVCAVALAGGHSVDDLVEFYAQGNLKFVFTPSHLNWFRPKYNNANFRTLVEKHLGDLSVGELKYNFMAPSFELDDRAERDWRPVFFHNFPDSPFLNEPVVDVVLRSAAAPTYFPSHDGFIDGGVMANNPSTAAIAIALGHKQPALQLADIKLLSIGTGLTPTIIKTNTTGWGEIQWLLNPFGKPSDPILNILFDGVVEADHTTSKNILGKNYWRVNPTLPRPMLLDDWQAYPELVETADKYDLQPTLDWMAGNWN
jgi:uncharacterized protein